MAALLNLFRSPPLIFALALLLRLALLAWGVYQDSTSPVKYTDIDYFVFTDAARAIKYHKSPYDRATYRYTPLLAWMLYPTTWAGYWFHFGKVLFAVSDLVAGYVHLVLLRRRGLSGERALKYASVWLLNPMVANISTRGSSEGFLCVLIMILLWAFETRRIALTGIMLGVCVHFKIYPFIYGASMLWALASSAAAPKSSTRLLDRAKGVFSADCIGLVLSSLATFTALNLAMYRLYGPEFIQHTYTHHLTRIDHRHNFSPYNALLYLSSSPSHSSSLPLQPESLAFIPQLALSVILLPLALAPLDLPTTLLSQTLAFVTFNKVCTSQYFLWYLVFLPIYLPTSSLVRRPRLGLLALSAWVAGQVGWLAYGFQLEFLGQSAWRGLFGASLGFFLINCAILGVVVGDVLRNAGVSVSVGQDTKEEGVQLSPVVPGPVLSQATPSFSATSSSSPQKQGRPRKTNTVDVSSVKSANLGPRGRVLKSN